MSVGASAPCRRAIALDHAHVELVVVVGARDDLERDRDGRHHERREQRVPERVDPDELRQRVVGHKQDQRVDDEHEDEAEREHERQPQRRHHGRQDRVEDRDRGGDHERRAGLLERHARDEDRGDVQRSRRQDPGDQQTQRAQSRLRRLPRHRLRHVWSSSRPTSCRPVRLSATSHAPAEYRRVMRRFAVVGHVEWVDFLTVPRVPRPGEIVQAEQVVVGSGGRRRGRGGTAREAGRHRDVLHGAGQRRSRAPCRSAAARPRRRGAGGGPRPCSARGPWRSSTPAVSARS